MENASKALIIAGAILLAIVIISLGLIVVQNTRNQINEGNVDQTAVEAYNSKILSYVGGNKTAQDVRNLCSTIISINGADETNQTGRTPIKINGEERKTYPTGTNMNKSQRFTVNAETGTGGYIEKVTINPDPYSGTSTP